MSARPLIASAALSLLLLAGGCDDPAGANEGDGRDWLVDATSGAGIDFVSYSGATGSRYLPEIMGAGVGLLDFDGDGDLDIYLLNGNSDPARGTPGGDVTNRLLRQDPGGRFTDVTAASGLGDAGFGMGLAVGDIDNDGDPDVYVTNFGPDRLYLNRGDGTFEDITGAAGIDVPGWSCSAAFLDYDGDGWLDLYVTQYVDFDPDRRCRNQAGEPIYCGPEAFEPVPDMLLRNTGALRFEDASAAAGIASIACAGLGVVCEDFDDNGRIDIYVANDADPNQLWINRGDGTFEDMGVQLGAAYNLHGQPEAGMGVIAEDLGNRGALDLFVTHLVDETNTLYRRSDGDLGFMDSTGPSGLGPSSRALTGFGTCAFDVELDGDLDLAVVNGRVRRGPVLPGARLGDPWDLLAEPKLLYLGDGAGRFRSAEDVAPTFCHATEISRGLAMGDVDGDGDVDLVVGNVESPARLYLNAAPRRGHWLMVRAVDPRHNRDAIGGRITVTAGGRTMTRSIRPAAGYLSSQDPRAHFGLGAAERVDALVVRWPDGARERFEAGCVDCVVEVRRGEGAPAP